MASLSNHSQNRIKYTVYTARKREGKRERGVALKFMNGGERER